MTTLIYFVVGGALLYALLKLALSVYRPFYLKKLFLQVEQGYTGIMRGIVNHLEDAEKDLSNYNKDSIITFDDLKGRVDVYIFEKKHEEDLHRKYITLKERFINNYRKLAESIVIYQRYLDIKQNQMKMSRIAHNLDFGSMRSMAMDTKAILDECERKIDFLLALEKK